MSKQKKEGKDKGGRVNFNTERAFEEGLMLRKVKLLIEEKALLSLTSLTILSCPGITGL